LRRCPLELRWFLDGLYVTATDADHTRALGCRVTRIGNAKPREAAELVNALVSDVVVRTSADKT